ncbi:MAG TPA: hypothetical protein PK858_03475, partial [Saprospiraceae bacterium]|nr:hypothetical protein [Saprospiraceae bacterium]
MSRLFRVRCRASDQKSGKIWTKADLFWAKWEQANQLLYIAYHMKNALLSILCLMLSARCLQAQTTSAP